MSEEKSLNVRELLPWQSPEELQKFREDFMRVNKGLFLNSLRDPRVNVEPSLIETADKLLMHMLFGIYIVFRRYNISNHPSFIIIPDGENVDLPMVAFGTEGNYLISSRLFKQLLENIKIHGQNFIEGGGSRGQISLEAFFEIAGVEEAAHALFIYEKGHTGGGKLPPKRPDPFYVEIDKYLSSDIESRALKWKLAFVRRYFPQYYTGFKKSSERVDRIRHLRAREKYRQTQT